MPFVIDAERAVIRMVSGAPVCSTVSTVNLPLSTSGSPTQPIDTSMFAPRSGIANVLRVSSTVSSSVSASSARDSVSCRLTRFGAIRRDRSRPSSVIR